MDISFEMVVEHRCDTVPLTVGQHISMAEEDSVAGALEAHHSLRVGGGNNHAVYQEDGLTACNTFDEEMTRHRGYLSGFATIENGTLTLTGTLWCIVPGMGRVPSEKLPVGTLVFTDNGDGTLDFDGVCYHRPGTPPC